MTNQFLNKTDLSFTVPQIKIILNHLITEYLDDRKINTKMTFDNVVSATANDLSISNEQIRTALSHPDVVEILANLKKTYEQSLEANSKIVHELNKPFAFKRDLDFSREELKEISGHAQKKYFGKKEYQYKKFETIIQGIADDLGLTSKQVRVAFYTIDKDVFKKMEETHNKTHNPYYDRSAKGN